MLRLLLALSLYTTTATVSKSTYAMSHPYAFKSWLEKYLPTAVNLVLAVVYKSHSESVAEQCSRIVRMAEGKLA